MKQDRARIYRYLLSAALLSALPVGRLTAHPHHPILQPGRQAATKRVPMRINQPPRVAPDEQTEPLEIGTRPVIRECS